MKKKTIPNFKKGHKKLFVNEIKLKRQKKIKMFYLKK